MPTYDYLCNACGAELEIFQSITERPRRKCPECGKPRLQRQIGAGAGILFRGSGFYQTDYRSSSYRKAQKAESEGSAGGSGSGDSSASKDSGAKKTAGKTGAQPGGKGKSD